MSNSDRERWDARYLTRPSPPVGDVSLPAVFTKFAEVFPAAGHGLELACGHGAASVWLARRGVTMVGIDVSLVAVDAARVLAAEAGVAERCRFDVADLDDGLPAGPHADVLICHLFRDSRLDAAIIGRLAPNGVLAISALSEVGAAPGPFRARPGELVAAFAALTVIAHDEVDGVAWMLARNQGAAN